MAFLDNSGDIILDAVLTDTGRMRLAKGDGSFRIAKFALGDDEIDYGNYNKNHPSGSAYYDLDILQTPVLEAFTNNISSMNSKLITVAKTNLLYLPIIKLNTNPTSVFGVNGGTPFDASGINTFLITVDETTSEEVKASSDSAALETQQGVLRGDAPAKSTTGIILDQGLDTADIPPTFMLDTDLVETQYLIEIDDRLGKVVSLPQFGPVAATPSFIDDDRIANYYLSTTTNASFISKIGTATNDSNLEGPRGSRLAFGVAASLNLNTSETLFNKLGDTFTPTGFTTSLKYIDSTIRITGLTTGYRTDISVRFVKKPSS
jgi:hypothetical protein